MKSLNRKTYLGDVDPESFDWRAYAKLRLPANYTTLSHEKKVEARRIATRNDPLLFAILYFSKSISAGGDGEITFADMHFDLCRVARHFAKPLDAVNPIRMAFLAPRRAGKTTWLYRILSFWVAAHGHRKFFYVLTGTGSQAQKWITNFKLVLEKNKFIQTDYPELCRPLKREATGRAFADDSNLYIAESGFIIGAQSADSNNLGLNLDDERPDIILADDIEPPGGSYSLHMMQQRLTNFIEGAIPMGQEGATILFVGTVHMPGSIADQIRIQGLEPDSSSWVKDIGLRVKHYKPFVDKVTGEETTFSTPTSRSFWVGRHKTEKLLREEHTRTFAKEYKNEPIPEDGSFWREDSISYSTIPANVPTITALSLDPAVTTKKKSDFTALTVIRYAPSIDKFEILYGRAFKLSPGTDMPQKVLEVLGYYPEITLLFLETNQGGDLWKGHYGDIPGVHYVPIRNDSNDGNKSKRAAAVLRMYETGQVFHSTETGANLKQLEQELYSFPKGLHDDLPDSMCFGVLNLLRRYSTSTAKKQQSWEGEYV